MSAYEKLSGVLQRQRQILSVTAWCPNDESLSEYTLNRAAFVFADLHSSECLRLLVCFAELHSCFNSNAWDQD